VETGFQLAFFPLNPSNALFHPFTLMSTEITQTRYDTVPYPIKSYPQTHPSKLAVIGRLFGMTPAPVDKCRVLELGCAHGGNLVPLAQALPESQFVGVDLACRREESHILPP
jgi:tRNA G46 methylase TrmB